MFNGIVEGVGRIVQIQQDGQNTTFFIDGPFNNKLKPDQSLAHNGVCLTVEKIFSDCYQVTAIDETLQKSNLGSLKEGDRVNLERSLQLNSFVDGHLVQGHVDCLGTCTGIREMEGSWVFSFNFPEEQAPLIVEKGSITINGVSLTAYDVTENAFKVSIIPYTFHHTTFQALKEGQNVNLEFDIIGKYLLRQRQLGQ